MDQLQGALNKTRTVMNIMDMTILKSNDFKGYLPIDVAYLLRLSIIEAPFPLQTERLRFGCTYGEYIAGFISPCTAFTLECQADIQGDSLDDDYYGTVSGSEWLEWHDSVLGNLPSRVRAHLGTNKSLRQGFVNLFKCVAETLRAKLLPTAEHVVRRAEGEWPPHTRNYLQRGGTVGAVVLTCFDLAMIEDYHLGSGDHREAFHDDIESPKECRNENEFIFASRQHCRVEGHSVNDKREQPDLFALQ